MTGVIAILSITFAFVAINEWNTFARLRYIVRSEGLRMRFSLLRHKVVTYAGSGKMGQDEKRSIRFLYEGTTFPLRCPFLYRDISFLVCKSFVDDVPAGPPKLRKGDLTSRTKPLLREYVEISEDLVNQFAHPLLCVSAWIGGRKVLEMFREIRAMERARKEAKKRVVQWRECAVRAAA